jgi:hypothetical protein
MSLTAQEKNINRFIFDKPEVVQKILERNGYKLSSKVTLPELTKNVFTAIYNGDKKTITDIVMTMQDEGYSMVVGMVIAGVASIASSLIAARQAKKQRELQKNITLANLENDKLLAEEKLRIYGETERTKILANTLQQYRSDLQSESTQRQKNVYVYLVAIGFGIAVIYGTVILLKEKA